MTITPATTDDINNIISLIQKRIKWMNEQGISQWNKSDYLKTFTLAYFNRVIDNGNLYKVKNKDNQIIGAFTLFDNDIRWSDNASALYIHNFVSLVGVTGVGDRIISFCEEVARKKGFSKLRIDCQQQNAKLNQYYEDRGFRYIDSFEETLYQGNRREKRLE